MDRPTPQQRLQVVQLYHEYQLSVKSVFYALRTIYGQLNQPTIWYIIDKVENHFALLNDT